MVYLGYDFSFPTTIEDLPEHIQNSLSTKRLDVAMSFLKDASNFIAEEVDLFGLTGSELSEKTVGISVMENYTGRDGFPDTEEPQAWHTDYGADGMEINLVFFISQLCINFVYKTEIENDMPNAQRPVVALLALDNDVKLGILPRSHALLPFEREIKFCSAIEYKFKLGEILLFNPLLVHFGCAYFTNEKSLRAHCYFDNANIQNQRSSFERRTFLLEVPVKPVVPTMTKEPGPTSLRGEGLAKYRERQRTLRIG